MSDSTLRTSVLKTAKLFVNGAFVRSESGRVYSVKDAQGAHLANVPLSSRKDLRDAVVAARAGQAKWAAMTAYNRGQVLYRLAEMLEARRSEFANSVMACQDLPLWAALEQVDEAIDLVVWYAGWPDKLGAVLGTVNPVAGPYLGLSGPRASGVVLALAGPDLVDVLAAIVPALAAGCSVIVVADSDHPLAALDLGELMATCDMPDGAVNILSGDQGELGSVGARHGDIDVLDVTGASSDLSESMARDGASTIKRVVNFSSHSSQSLARVRGLVETTTVWHSTGQ